MKYQIVPFDPNHFATDLQRIGKSARLDWTSSSGQDALIVQTPYGVRATDCSAELTGEPCSVVASICEKLAEAEPPTEYTEILPYVWIRYVSAADKVRMQGCEMHGEASTYSVFACERSGDSITVFTPQDQAMIQPFCDIPLEFCVELFREKVIVRRLLRSVERETGFFVLRFPKDAADWYHDGDLSVEVEGVRIPVTKAMLEQAEVFVLTEQTPKLSSRSRGLSLKVLTGSAGS